MKVAVGLSGGVDSAVTALLLRDQGYEVVGVHLYCWPPKSEYLKLRSHEDTNLRMDEEKLRREWIKKNGCRADEDEQLALKTALELGIKFIKLDFSEEYNKKVVDYFYAEYEAGRTPNPDVLCNSEIKFGLFLDWALKNNFDYIATGHYARLNHGSELAKDVLELRPSSTSADPLRATFAGVPAPLLCIPKDKHKDQTYFLWKLTQKELKHVLFPLGDYLKSEVREIALKNNLTVAKRKDSQGICFIGNVEAREFLSRRLKEKPGIVRDVKGNVIGEHSGVWFYTIGQRGGWKINSKLQNSETPIYYVVSKDAAKNELVVGVGKETESDSFSITEVNGVPEGKMLVRIRHTGQLIPCKVKNNRVELIDPQKGVAPGQSAVFYSEDGVMLGGGVIA